jgi:uracil-DNA glycosylase
MPLPGGSIDELIERLVDYSPAKAFNQYRQAHPDLDRPGATDIRIRNLRRYLHCFEGARVILVGEAAGYAGCRFSGIPFTCEAQIAGPAALPWTAGLGLQASSAQPSPWNEMSATVVWGALGNRRDCLLWNAFPWHPCGTAGPLSNCAPKRKVQAGLEVLRTLLAMFPGARPVAVGRVAQRALTDLGICAPYVRHPSHGGRHAFEAGLAALETH